MFYNPQQPRPKPPCPVCQLIRRTVFLMIGVGIFAYYAFSPEQRRSDSFAVLLELLTIENATIAVIIGIGCKLIFDAAKHFLRK